jgi:hypothetical protein
MPSIDIKFLTQLKDSFRKYKCFVETGTYQGETIMSMEPFFNHLYTIEISPLYYERTKNNYRRNKINFILGDSSKVFLHLLPEIEEPAIFFLDGHWSSGDTGRGEKDCPLNEEINLITTLFKHDAILIVDDYRLFGHSPMTGLNEDWSDINKDKILSILGDRVTNVYHLPSPCREDDRLIIHIKAKSD